MGAIKIPKQDLLGYQNIFCRSSRKILVGTKKDFDVFEIWEGELISDQTGIGRMVFFLQNFMIWLDDCTEIKIMGGKRIICGYQKGKGVGHAIKRICIDSLASCTWLKNWSALISV